MKLLLQAASLSIRCPPSVPPIWSDQLFSWAVLSYICPGTVQCTVYTVYTHQSVPFLNSLVKTQPQVRPVEYIKRIKKLSKFYRA